MNVAPPGPAPEVNDDVMDLERATAHGGRHRLLRSGWLGYALLLLTPLALALIVAAISTVPPPHNNRRGPAAAGGEAGRVPVTPIPAPAVPTAAATGTPLPTGSPAANSTRTPAGRPLPPPPTSGPPEAPDLVPTGGPGVLQIAREAESAELGKQLSNVAMASASGGEVVTGLGKNKPRTMTFPEITVTVAGTYELRVWYAAAVAVNVRVRTSAGTDSPVLCPATGGTSALRSYAIAVKLGIGTNTIILNATTKDVPVVDRITVSQT